MDGLKLICEAKAAGLRLRVDGDRLVIRGPRSAGPIAERVLANKDEVLAAMRGTAPTNAEPIMPQTSTLGDDGAWLAVLAGDPEPAAVRVVSGAGACYWCGRSDWWRSKAWPDVIRCGNCCPPAPWVPVDWLNRPEGGRR